MKVTGSNMVGLDIGNEPTASQFVNELRDCAVHPIPATQKRIFPIWYEAWIKSYLMNSDCLLSRHFSY